VGAFPCNRLFQHSVPAAGESPAPNGQPAFDAGAGSRCPSRLGDLLVKRGVGSGRDVAMALARQRFTGRRLGEELVLAGSQPLQLRAALDLQRSLRKAAR